MHPGFSGVTPDGYNSTNSGQRAVKGEIQREELEFPESWISFPEGSQLIKYVSQGEHTNIAVPVKK